MATIVDTLLTLAQDLRDAIASVRGIEGRVRAAADTNATRVTTIINNFISRPSSIMIFCDPINGDDSKDGSTLALAKKSLDAILASMTGPSGVVVLLLADTVLRERANVNGPLELYGCQRANNAVGYTFLARTISFLGTAENSPFTTALGPVTFPSGMFLNGPKLNTQYINFTLATQPAGQSYNEHITASAGSLAFVDCGVNVSANAGFLVGAGTGRVNVFASFILGAGAAGRLFKGVAAGANPNNSYNYVSNLTSA